MSDSKIHNFKVGDLVQLKSGGMLMTVDSVSEMNGIVCSYFEGGHLEYITYSSEVLVRRDMKIENAFTYHAPKDGQPERYEAMRAMYKELAYHIDENVRDSREKSTALTNLEQSMFWANAGIARNE